MVGGWSGDGGQMSFTPLPLPPSPLHPPTFTTHYDSFLSSNREAFVHDTEVRIGMCLFVCVGVLVCVSMCVSVC